MDDTPIPAAATQVLHDFVAAGKRQDVEAMKACLTKATLESGAFRSETPPGVDFVVGEASRQDGRVIIPMKVVPEGAGPDAEALDELPCVVVEEDGAWKFDLATTIDLKMGGMQQALEQAMTQMGEAMGEAMSGVAEAMQQAFGSDTDAESSWDDRTSWDDVPDPDPQALPLAREVVTLPNVQEALGREMGFGVRVGVDLPGFVRLFNTEETEGDTLRTWFDDQLLANWPGLIAYTRSYFPLEERFTAIRLEPANAADERFIAMDGTELLYRLDPRTQDGFYSDDELGAILPGVLAGAPMHGEAEQLAAGRTFFPPDDTLISFDEYIPVAERWMKRISSLLGHYVALEADWAEISMSCFNPRMIFAWGLNRVYGGLAAASAVFAPGDPEVRFALDSLQAIRFRRVFTVEDRCLRLADGVLDVAMVFSRDEAGAFYEHQIAAAVAGTPVLPEGWEESGLDTQADTVDAAAGPDPELQAMDAMNAMNAMDAFTSPDSPEGVDLSDPYAVASMYMDQLEAAMHAASMWPGDAPASPDQIEIRGPFGRENMSLEQWLAWVLIPRVREICAERGQFPTSSSVGAYAVREFDGRDEASEVLSALARFDAYVEGLADAQANPDL